MGEVIPDGCVLLITGSRHLARPWGCGRLAGLRPALVIHGGAQGAEAVAAAFFAKSGVPVEVSTLMWFEAEAPPAHADNGGTLAHAQVRAQEMGVALHALALWDGGSAETNNMIGRLRRANVPALILRQLAPSVESWSEDLREEIDEVAGRWLADRVEVGKAATKEQTTHADLHAEGVVRAAFAWRNVSPAS